MFGTPPIMTFDSDGVEIAYVDTGSIGAASPTPVLLIHGFASNLMTNWVTTGWFDALTRAGHRVIAFDHRGHGRSQKLYRIEDYGSPLMAEDARRLLDHLGVARAHVVGYSMGARVSAFLTLHNPGQVASVTFAGLGIAMIQGMGQRGDVIADALEAPTAEDVQSDVGRTFRIFADQTKSDRRALAACMRSGRQPITAEALAGIRCPVLVVVGTTDTIAGSPSELAALIPGAKWLAPAEKDHMRTVGDRAFKEAVLAMIAGT